MPYTCTVKQGNLLDEESATFIVNASNTTMVLGSGVSAAFREKCGVILQQEMSSKLKSLNQKLQKGDVIATSSGEASNFKYALHAAVMDYNQGTRGKDKFPTIEDIETILINIEPYLQWYSDHHPEETITLVLPLMGCGVGGLDKQKVLESYHDFFQKDVAFNCQVIIYGYSDEDYKLAKEICYPHRTDDKRTYPLLFESNHLFVILDNKKWLIDTGSPVSFGEPDSLTINDNSFDLSDTYGNLDTDALSEHIGIEVLGLIGVDILNHFDILLDLPSGVMSVSKEELPMEGTIVPLEQFMGIPIIEAVIDGRTQKMFFDTGAQISYWQDEALNSFPSLGKVTDFYPGFGEFETETYQLELSIGTESNKLICGSLPGLLSETLMMASAQGIIGNEIMKDQILGYFPRRKHLAFL